MSEHISKIITILSKTTTKAEFDRLVKLNKESFLRDETDKETIQKLRERKFPAGNVRVEVKFTEVVKVIQTNFPEFTLYNHGMQKSMWLFQQANQKGYYLSVKIPSDNETGKAIHVNVRCRLPIKSGEIKDYNVYPVQDIGRGHFKSKSIPRTAFWRDSLVAEIKSGIALYRQKFNKQN